MRDIGDRMKRNYECRFRHELVRRVPVIVRVDGRAFHTYARGFRRPFDAKLMSAMDIAAYRVARQVQGCKAVYVQSDEASFLLTDYDTLATEAWFGYCQNKVESISASLMTAEFNSVVAVTAPDRAGGRLATFDARAFNVPREDVANYFLWRVKDWERNSLSMYCGAFFTPREMHKKSASQQHEMLCSIGKNWATNLNCREKNGWWYIVDASATGDLRTYDEISSAIRPGLCCDEEDRDETA